MALKRWLATGLLCGSLAAPSAAQDLPSRPGMLAAVGLITYETVTLEHEGYPVMEISLPSSDEVTARIQDVPEDADDVIAAFEFVTETGVMAESLVLTPARIAPADPETRRFAMANLLVLRSFPPLGRTFDDAQLLAFGPLDPPEGFLGTQMLGTFTSPDGAPIFFRHVGLMLEDTDASMVAIVNTNAGLLPVRTENDMTDTFSDLALRSLTIVAPAE